jgi:hypothetical protein
MSHIIVMTASSDCRRRSCACVRRRIAARRSCRTRCKVEPADHFINWQQDPFANYLARLVFPEKTREFKVTVDLVAEMAVYNPFDFFLEESAEKFPFKYDEALATELAPYLVKRRATGRASTPSSRASRSSRKATMDFLVALNQRLQGDIRYLIRMEPGVQTPEETLTLASGSCRDSGWLLVQTLRQLGLAARFVSGYLIQLAPDQKALDGPSGTESRLHRPARLVRGLPARRRLDRLRPDLGPARRRGPHPARLHAAAVERRADQRRRRRVRGRVRATTWRHAHLGIAARHQAVHRGAVAGDAALGDAGRRATGGRRRAPDDGRRADLRLDRRPRRRRMEHRRARARPSACYAQELVLRLRDRYGAGGFLHYGQGKWYPGEQLPRWALSIYWRADGQPCWTTRRCSPTSACRSTTPPPTRSASARRWRASWARSTPHAGRLRGHVLLPVARAPAAGQRRSVRRAADDELERNRLRRVYDARARGAVVGYVLPLRREPGPGLVGGRWVTGPWHFRGERMYLIPGDSPMGYRLPLDSLPGCATTSTRT